MHQLIRNFYLRCTNSVIIELMLNLIDQEYGSRKVLLKPKSTPTHTSFNYVACLQMNKTKLMILPDTNFINPQ